MIRFRPIFFALLLGLSSAATMAQETTLKVGVSAARPGDPPVTQNLSTAQVDSVLNTVLPSRFGAHFTRDKANAAFSRVEAMRMQLNTRLAAMSFGPDVQITSVSVNANPLQVAFEQTPSGVRATVSGLSASASARYTKYDIPLICESVNGRFTIDYITVSGDYDIASGNLVNLQANYALTNVSTSCGGLLGSFGDVLRDAIGFGTGFVRQLLLSELQSAVNQQLQMFNMRSIFSISDFLDGLRNFSNISILNDFANDAIDKGQQIVANPSSFNRALRLTVSVAYGAAGNTVSFIASHAEETPFGFDNSLQGYNITLFRSSNTAQVLLFTRQPNTSGFQQIATIPAGVSEYFLRGGLPVGTQVFTISQSSASSRLYSLGGPTATVNYTPGPTGPSCRRPPCSPIEPAQ